MGPAHRLDVVVEVFAAFFEIGEVPIAHVGDMAAHVRLGQFNEHRADGVADAARARVQHEPDAIGFVETHFDEVIAGAQRTEVLAVVGFLQARIPLRNAFECRQQIGPLSICSLRGIVPGALVAAAAGRAAPVWHGMLDGAAQASETVRQVGTAQAGTGGDHAATDIHAHGSGNDGALRRDDAADGRALAQVHVRHDGKVAVDEGHTRRVHELLAGLVFHGNAGRPHLDRFAVFHFQQFILHIDFLLVPCRVHGVPVLQDRLNAAQPLFSTNPPSGPAVPWHGARALRPGRPRSGVPW